MTPFWCSDPRTKWWVVAVCDVGGGGGGGVDGVGGGVRGLCFVLRFLGFERDFVALMHGADISAYG